MTKEKNNMTTAVSRRLGQTAAATTASRTIRGLMNAACESSLDQLREEVVRHHREFEASARAAVMSAVLCGIGICGLRYRCPSGEWEQQYRDRHEPMLGISLRQAQRYMKRANDYLRFVADNRGDVEDELTLDSALFQKFCHATQQPQKQLPTEDLVSPLNEAATAFLGDFDCIAPPSLERHSAQSNEVAEFRGDATGSTGRSTLWIAPDRRDVNLRQWTEQTLRAVKNADAAAALIVLPLATGLSIPELFQVPIAILRGPEGGHSSPSKVKSTARSHRAVFLIARQPDLQSFAEHFRDIATVFAPVHVPISTSAANSSQNRGLDRPQPMSAERPAPIGDKHSRP